MRPTKTVSTFDGIEIPNINHFATARASGDLVGMINVDLCRRGGFLRRSFFPLREAMPSVCHEFHFKDPRISGRPTL